MRKAEKFFLRGFSLYKHGKYLAALHCYDKALKINPYHHKAWFYRGLLLEIYDEFNQSTIKLAIESYEKCLSLVLNSDNAFITNKQLIYRSFFYRGKGYQQLGKHQIAIASFEEAIEVMSNRDEVWLYLGHSLRCLSRFSEAMNSYEKALQLNKKSYENWYYKGELAQDIGCNTEANHCYKEVLKLDCDDHFMLINQGNYLLCLKEYATALQCFDLALKFSPIDDEALLKKGITLFYLGHYREVQKVLHECLKLNPNSALGWYWQGECLLVFRAYSDALNCYSKAINLIPSFEQAWNRRGELLQKLGLYEYALDNNAALIAITQRNWKKLAELLFKMKFFQGCLIILDQLIAQQPWDCDVWHSKATVLFEMGDVAEANNCMEQAKHYGCRVQYQRPDANAS